MPKNRKLTYSDHQSEAARQKKQAPKPKGPSDAKPSTSAGNNKKKS